MVKIKEQEKELFFVQLKEPNEARRNILETLKEIVEVLHKFEKFKHIRHAKIENINHLRVLLKQANKMLGDLRLKLPQTNLRANVIRKPQKPNDAPHKKGKKVKTAETKIPKKDMTELERLEAELGAIESKLKSLS